MEKRVYYFNLSWWVIFYFVGFLFMWASIYLAVEAPLYPLTSLRNLSINIIGILLIIFILLFGLLCVVAPLIMKLVVSSEGIEWHSLAAVIKFHWYDVDVRIPQNSSIEKISFKVKNPRIKLRSWTRYAPWDAEKGALHNLNHQGLPIAQYGGLAPHKLVDDLRRWSSNHE